MCILLVIRYGTRLNMKMRGPAGQGDSFSRGYCVYTILVNRAYNGGR